MSGKRKGLGRGLDALLGTSMLDTPASADTLGDSSHGLAAGSDDGALKNIAIEFLQRGKYQPRRDMHPEALEELADSIRTQGIMQPIVVRPIGGERYEIIAGERRWRAAQMAGLDEVPALIRQVGDEAAIAMALIENIQREDLNPIEEAAALSRLQKEFELTQQEVAQAVGKSRATVANLMRLLALESHVRTMLERGDIEMGHARALLALGGQKQIEAAKIVVGKGMTVRQTEALVKKLLSEPTAGAKSTQIMDADLVRLQDRVAETVGLPVNMSHSASGKGKVTFSYSKLEELEGLLERLHVSVNDH
ncbi:MAG: ParB/RepB/Spo0J family partition protein [Porticoccaceae bacterium]|nr:ParB/RepB/Spo0J family partition protein [Porticoccaceae bacterium]